MPKSKPPPSTPSTTSHPTGSQQGTPTMPTSAPKTFADILNTKAEDITPPPLIPAGAYLCQVDGNYEQGESQNTNKTPFIRFQLKLLAVHGELADPDRMEDANASIGRKMRFDTYFSENNTDISLNSLKNFAIACGIDVGNKPLVQFLSECPGCQVVATINNEMSKPRDGSEPVPVARLGNRFAAP